MPKFVTKAGWLTPYALACGYQEAADGVNGERLRLFTYPGCQGTHVRYQCAWEVYETLSEARREFHRICKSTGMTRRLHHVS